MKKVIKILALIVAALAVLSMVACSSTFGSVKSNFEENGYEYVTGEDGNGIFDSIVAEFEDGGISFTLHVFRAAEKEKPDKNGSFGSLIGDAIDSLVNAVDYCGVVEFASDEDMRRAISESDTLRAMISDAQQSDYVNGNCILIPGFVKVEEKIAIFKGN